MKEGAGINAGIESEDGTVLMERMMYRVSGESLSVSYWEVSKQE